MTTDYIGDGSPSALAAGLRQWVDSVPSHARPLLVAAADALVAPVAPARTLLEQCDLEQSPEYRKGYEAGRHKGYKVGHQHGMDAARMAAPVAPAESVCARCGGIRCADPLLPAETVAPALVPLTDEQIDEKMLEILIRVWNRECSADEGLDELTDLLP